MAHRRDVAIVRRHHTTSFLRHLEPTTKVLRNVGPRPSRLPIRSARSRLRPAHGVLAAGRSRGAGPTGAQSRPTSGGCTQTRLPPTNSARRYVIMDCHDQPLQAKLRCCRVGPVQAIQIGLIVYRVVRRSWGHGRVGLTLNPPSNTAEPERRSAFALQKGVKIMDVIVNRIALTT